MSFGAVSAYLNYLSVINMDIKKLEQEYLTKNQIAELSESEKYHLIVRLMAERERDGK